MNRVSGLSLGKLSNLLLPLFRTFPFGRQILRALLVEVEGLRLRWARHIWLAFKHLLDPQQDLLDRKRRLPIFFLVEYA